MIFTETEWDIIKNRLDVLIKGRNKMIWSKVQVDWCEELGCWTVGGYDSEGNRENLSGYHKKEWAVDDAMIYAFDTSCGPQRGAKVEIYTKGNKLIKTINRGA